MNKNEEFEFTGCSEIDPKLGFSYSKIIDHIRNCTYEKFYCPNDCHKSNDKKESSSDEDDEGYL